MKASALWYGNERFFNPMHKVKIDQRARYGCKETPNRSKGLLEGKISHEETGRYNDTGNI